MITKFKVLFLLAFVPLVFNAQELPERVSLQEAITY